MSLRDKLTPQTIFTNDDRPDSFERVAAKYIELAMKNAMKRVPLAGVEAMLNEVRNIASAMHLEGRSFEVTGGAHDGQVIIRVSETYFLRYYNPRMVSLPLPVAGLNVVHDIPLNEYLGFQLLKAARTDRDNVAQPAAPAVKKENTPPPGPAKSRRRKLPEGSILNGYDTLIREFRQRRFTRQEFQEKRVRSTGTIFSYTTVVSELQGLEDMGIVIADKEATPHTYRMARIFDRGPPALRDGIKPTLAVLPALPSAADLAAAREKIVSFVGEEARRETARVASSRYATADPEPLIQTLLLFWPDRDLTPEEKDAVKAFISEVDAKKYFDFACGLVHRDSVKNGAMNVGKMLYSLLPESRPVDIDAALSRTILSFDAGSTKTSSGPVKPFYSYLVEDAISKLPPKHEWIASLYYGFTPKYESFFGTKDLSDQAALRRIRNGRDAFFKMLPQGIRSFLTDKYRAMVLSQKPSEGDDRPEEAIFPLFISRLGDESRAEKQGEARQRDWVIADMYFAGNVPLGKVIAWSGMKRLDIRAILSRAFGERSFLIDRDRRVRGMKDGVETLYMVKFRDHAVLCDEAQVQDFIAGMKAHIERNKARARKDGRDAFRSEYDRMNSLRRAFFSNIEYIRVTASGRVALSEQFTSFYENAPGYVLIENPRLRLIEVWPSNNIPKRPYDFLEEGSLSAAFLTLVRAGDMVKGPFTMKDYRKKKEEVTGQAGHYMASVNEIETLVELGILKVEDTTGPRKYAFTDTAGQMPPERFVLMAAFLGSVKGNPGRETCGRLKRAIDRLDKLCGRGLLDMVTSLENFDEASLGPVENNVRDLFGKDVLNGERELLARLEQHEAEVARVADHIARTAGVDEKTRSVIRIAAAAHDLGKALSAESLALHYSPKRKGDMSPEELARLAAHDRDSLSILAAGGIRLPAETIILIAVNHDPELTSLLRSVNPELWKALTIFDVSDQFKALTETRPYERDIKFEKPDDISAWLGGMVAGGGLSSETAALIGPILRAELFPSAGVDAGEDAASGERPPDRKTALAGSFPLAFLVPENPFYGFSALLLAGAVALVAVNVIIYVKALIAEKRLADYLTEKDLEKKLRKTFQYNVDTVEGRPSIRVVKGVRVFGRVDKSGRAVTETLFSGRGWSYYAYAPLKLYLECTGKISDIALTAFQMLRLRDNAIYNDKRIRQFIRSCEGLPYYRDFVPKFAGACLVIDEVLRAKYTFVIDAPDHESATAGRSRKIELSDGTTLESALRHGGRDGLVKAYNHLYDLLGAVDLNSPDLEKIGEIYHILMCIKSNFVAGADDRSPAADKGNGAREGRKPPKGSILEAFNTLMSDEALKGSPFTRSEFRERRKKDGEKSFSRTTVDSEVNGLVALGILSGEKSGRVTRYTVNPAYLRAPPGVMGEIRAALSVLPARPSADELSDARKRIEQLVLGKGEASREHEGLAGLLVDRTYYIDPGRDDAAEKFFAQAGTDIDGLSFDLPNRLKLSSGLREVLTNSFEAVMRKAAGMSEAGRASYAGKITLTVRGADGVLLISVVDNGDGIQTTSGLVIAPGVPASMADHEKASADLPLSSKGANGGSGLNLTRTLLNAAGGTIHWEPVRSGGTRVVMTVPENVLDASALAYLAERRAETAASDPERLKVSVRAETPEPATAKKAAPEKKRAPAPASSYGKLRADKDVDLYYLREIPKINLELLRLSAERATLDRQKKAGTLDEGGDKRLAECLSRLAGLRGRIDKELTALPERYTNLSLTGGRDFRAEAANKAKLALESMDRKNEPAACTRLCAANRILSEEMAALSELGRKPRSRARVWFDSRKAMLRVMKGQYMTREIEGERTVSVIVRKTQGSKLLWQAIRSCDEQFDGMLNEREWIKGLLPGLDKVIETGRAKAREEELTGEGRFARTVFTDEEAARAEALIREVAERTSRAIVKEKDITASAAELALELMSAREQRGAVEMLGTIKGMLSTRLSALESMVSSVKAGRLAELRRRVHYRNSKLVWKAERMIALIDEGKEDAARGLIMGITRELDVKDEPEFNRMLPVLWQADGRISQGAKPEIAKRDVGIFKERVRLAELLDSFMEDLRDQYVDARIDGSPASVLETLFTGNFNRYLDFAKENNIGRGSPRLLWVFFNLPVHVSMEMPNPDKPSQKIDNPLFGAMLDLVRLLEVNGIRGLAAAIEKSKQKKYARLLASLKSFLDRGIKELDSLDRAQYEEILKALALDLELNEDQTAEFLKAAAVPAGARALSDVSRRKVYFREMFAKHYELEKAGQLLKDRCGLFPALERFAMDPGVWNEDITEDWETAFIREISMLSSDALAEKFLAYYGPEYAKTKDLRGVLEIDGHVMPSLNDIYVNIAGYLPADYELPPGLIRQYKEMRWIVREWAYRHWDGAPKERSIDIVDRAAGRLMPGSPPRGSIYGAFRTMFDDGMGVGEINIKYGADIAAALGRSYDTVEPDLRALALHLHLLEVRNAQGGRAYFMTERVAANAQRIMTILERFRSDDLRPPVDALEKVYAEEIEPILRLTDRDVATAVSLLSFGHGTNKASELAEWLQSIQTTPDILLDTIADDPKLADLFAGSAATLRDLGSAAKAITDVYLEAVSAHHQGKLLCQDTWAWRRKMKDALGRLKSGEAALMQDYDRIVDGAKNPQVSMFMDIMKRSMPKAVTILEDRVMLAAGELSGKTVDLNRVLGLFDENITIKQGEMIRECFRLSRANGPVLVPGNEGALLSMVCNIASNGACKAYKIRGKEAKVEITLCKEGPDAVIRISDNGPGMTPQQIEDIRKPFYTTGGTGVGMTEALATARLHRGRIDIDSEPGKGAVFTIRIPLAGNETFSAGEDSSRKRVMDILRSSVTGAELGAALAKIAKPYIAELSGIPTAYGPVGYGDIFREIRDRVGFDGKSMLEVGPAYGTFMYALKEYCRNEGLSLDLKGIDIDPGPSSTAREKGGLDVVTGDVTDLPLELKGAQFDCVLYRFPHFERMSDAVIRDHLNAYYSLTKPGGLCLIATAYGFDELSEDAVSVFNAARAAGFDVVPKKGSDGSLMLVMTRPVAGKPALPGATQAAVPAGMEHLRSVVPELVNALQTISFRKETVVLAIDEELGSGATQEGLSVLCKTLERLTQRNDELGAFLKNIVIRSAKGRALAEGMNELVKRGVKKENIVVITKRDNLDYFRDLEGAATMTAIDDKQLTDEHYFPFVEVTLFTIARAIGYGKEQLMRVYREIPNTQALDEKAIIMMCWDDASNSARPTVVIRLIPGAVKAADKAIYKEIAKFIATAA